MDDLQLPEELAGLEQRLAARPLPEPSPGLRGRVMAAICQEGLRHSPVGASAGVWRFAAAVAALLMLCLNLSMTVANHADWDVWGGPGRRDVASRARQLREGVPELSEPEALRVARVMDSGSRLIPAPDLRRRRRWATGTREMRIAIARRETADGIRPGVD